MDLAAFSALDLSAAGLLAIAILLILIGKLVPRSVVQDMRTDRDSRLTEARHEIQNWKSAYETEAESRRLQAHQLGELLELAKVTEHFVRSLQEAARKDSQQ